MATLTARKREADEGLDVAVVGGSYAGLSAALQLARARQRVLVIDAGQRRNRFADTSHGFLGCDGDSPEAIATQARAQLLAYATVQWVDGEVANAEPADTGFALGLTDGRRFVVQRLVLATGVVDELPDLEGLAERWGRSVFHCPYCHGYELAQGHIGVLASGPMGDFIRTDAFKETTVPGVFACGDAARAAGSVALAVSDGAMAGAGAHRALVFR